MKFNLKNRPRPNHSIEDLEKRLEDHSFNVAVWFEGFEKELREYRLNVKGDWETENSKGWGNDKEQMAFYRGQNSVYKEILGE